MTKGALAPVSGRAVRRAREFPHRGDVEGLRAVAVGLVVAYHAGVPHLAGGFVGVDVFFVISGFLITGILVAEIEERGTLSFGRFYARRARRLLPMATVVLVAIALTFSLVLLPIDRGGLRRDIWAAALYFANWHFAASSVAYGTNASVNPVLHFWSLSVEEQFYVAWPILLYVVTRGGFTIRRVVVALSAVAAASLALSIVLTPRSAPYAYYGLHTRAWELAAGGLLAVWAQHGKKQPSAVVRGGLGWLGLAAIVASAVIFDGSTQFPGSAALLPVSGTLAVLAASTTTTGAGRLLALPPVTYVGRLSYSLYLWHWPCLVLLGTLATSDRAGFTVAHGGRAAVAVGIALALSVVSHHTIENPARVSSRLRATPRALVLGASAMALSVLAGAALLPASAGTIRSPVVAYVASLSGAPASPHPLRVRLTMSPGQARADKPHGTGNCYGSYQATSAPASCAFGDRSATTSVALIGDSHAEALFPAMERVAIANHWKLWLWAKPACPVIDLTVRLPQFDNSYSWCTTWQRNVIARLQTIPDLRTVFVTNFAGAVDLPGRFAVGGGPALSPAQVPAAWSQAWSTTDRELTADGARVTVIRDLPQPLTDIPDCLEQHSPDEIPCSNPRSVATHYGAVLTQAERATSTTGTTFINLDATLCPDALCPVVTSTGEIIYPDSEHITATVSAQLAPALEAALAGAGG